MRSLQDRACICCGARTVEAPRLPGLLRCEGCGHVRADASLDDTELRELYSRQYFHGEEYLDYEREAPALRRNFARSLQRLTELVPEGGRLWEIGTAYGYFLRQAGEVFDASGCDISEHAVRFAREQLGVAAIAGDYLELDTDPPYDVICLWDTIEHLRDPHLYLAKAAEELRAGGVLALSTGDIGSLVARVRGARWRLIHPPTHLHYFTTGSIRELLQRLGFAEIRVHHPPFWRTLDSVAYHTLAHPPGRATAVLYERLRRTGLLKIGLPVNTFDLMTVYAVKAEEDARAA